MRSLREYYERNFTPVSTRNESLTGPLQDPVGRIFEHMQNEECSLEHLVRAVSILLWLVNMLEDNGISLDRQTREEVEVCAVGLTKEYLQRRRHDVEGLIWVVEWSSTRTIKEIAPQVSRASIAFVEGVETSATLVYRTRLAGVADLGDLARLRDLARLLRLAPLVRLACLTDLTDVTGAASFVRLAGELGDAYTNFVAVQPVGSLARLALDEAPRAIG
jgi:hypothetical protein